MKRASKASKALVPVLALIAVAALTASAFILMGARAATTSVPPHATAPVWHHVKATPVPQSAVPKSNVVIPASAPVRLQIPSINFDSSKLAGKGISNPIQKWTKAMNDAANGEATPPGPWWSSVIWDSTVAGGGLFGTDAQSDGRILAHMTPNSYNPLGAFQGLRNVHLGDPVVITTQTGKLCYHVVASDTVKKDLLNVVYDKKVVLKGIVYLITCNRLETDHGTRATTENLVITLRLNQQQTNTGSC
jgi:hypothetical protein